MARARWTRWARRAAGPRRDCGRRPRRSRTLWPSLVVCTPSSGTWRGIKDEKSVRVRRGGRRALYLVVVGVVVVGEGRMKLNSRECVRTDKESLPSTAGGSFRGLALRQGVPSRRVRFWNISHGVPRHHVHGRRFSRDADVFCHLHVIMKWFHTRKQNIPGTSNDPPSVGSENCFSYRARLRLTPRAPPWAWSSWQYS